MPGKSKAVISNIFLLLLGISLLLGCASDEEAEVDGGLHSTNAGLNDMLIEAESLLEQERLDEAVVAYETAVSDFPQEPAAFVGRGRAYTIQEAYADAQADFEHALSLDETYAPAYLERGMMRREQGDYEAAAADFDQALALNPRYSAVYVNRGLLYERQGDPVAAFKEYGQAIQIDPNNPTPYRNRGTLLFTIFFDDASALADFNRALALDETDIQALTSRAMYYITYEDWAMAQTDVNRAFDLGTNAPQAYTMRALVGQALGNSTGVIEDFDRAVQIDPTYWQGYQMRMLYHFEQENWRAALADAQHVIELDAGEQSLAHVYYFQGLLHENYLEDFAQARDDYLQAVTLLPNNADFNLALADLYNYQFLDAPSALPYYDRAIELEPTKADAYFGRGLAYLYFEIPNDERPLSDFNQYLRLAGDTNPEQAELARYAIDQLTVTFSDQLLGFLAQSFVEDMLNPVASDEAEAEQFWYVRQQYFNPRTGGLQDTPCSDCQDRSYAVEGP